MKTIAYQILVGRTEGELAALVKDVLDEGRWTPLGGVSMAVWVTTDRHGHPEVQSDYAQAMVIQGE